MEKHCLDFGLAWQIQELTQEILRQESVMWRKKQPSGNFLNNIMTSIVVVQVVINCEIIKCENEEQMRFRNASGITIHIDIRR